MQDFLLKSESDGLALTRLAEFGHYFKNKDELETMVIDEVETASSLSQLELSLTYTVDPLN